MDGVIDRGLVAALVALLIVAAIGDLRTRTIPNWLNAAIALLAIAWWFAADIPLWPDVAMQVGAALILLLLFGAVFAFGGMGGGDVKLIVALALWVPVAALGDMLVVMALSGGLLTIAMLAWHRWRRAEGRPEIPYGVAIVAAGCWVVANDLLTIPGS